MKLVRTLQCSFVVALLCATLSPRVNADEWNKKTILTTSDSLEVPGYILPAGTYVFKLAENPAYRHIVQIWTGDETHVIATIMAIPAYRDEVSDDPVFRFEERPGDSPQAIRAWFYSGEHYGNEFTYPRSRYYDRTYNNSSDNGAYNNGTDNSNYNNSDNSTYNNGTDNGTYNNGTDNNGTDNGTYNNGTDNGTYNNGTDNGAYNNDSNDNNDKNKDKDNNPDSQSSDR